MSSKSFRVTLISIFVIPVVLLLAGVIVCKVFFPEAWAEAQAETAAEQQAATQQKAEADRLKEIERCFSGWDGAHYELKKYVKKQMHDPDSFECNAATWQPTEGGSTIMVTMGYSGTNGYGARVNAVVTAECLVSGEVLQVF